MDIPQVLAAMPAYQGPSWGPMAQTGVSYADFAAKWPAESGSPPTEDEMLAVWADLEATRAAREAQARRTEAIALLMASNEPRDVALRALIRDLYTQHNDLRELHGLPRILEPDVITRVVTGIGDGLGEV